MGGSQSKSNMKNEHEGSLRSFGEKIKTNVENELGQRMMLQREVQMAINIAKARDSLQIFGSAWLTFVSGELLF